MLLTRALALLLFFADMTLPETIEIARFLPQNKLKKWRDGIDTFTLSESECSQTENHYLNCTNLCETDERAGNHHFRCSCSDSSPTLTYNNSQWTCQEKGQVRSQFGCGVSTLFTDEEGDDRLRILNTDRARQTKLTQWFCSVSLNNSWYIGCHGEKQPLKQNTKLFQLEWWRGKYHIQVLNDSSLQGRIINLGINCLSTAGPYRAGCLLFKLEGTLSCLIRKPPLYGFQSSTVPTVSLSSSIKTTPLTSTTTLESTATLASEGTTKSIMTPTKPDTGFIKEQQKHGDTSSSSSLGLIAGVSASIATVLLVIAVFVLYRRRKPRKGAHVSTSEEFKKNGNSEQNVAFQRGAQDDYLPNRMKEPRNSHIGEVYAALDVPEGHNIYGTGNVDEPFYNFLQAPVQDNEEGQRYSCLSLEPALYHTLEKLQIKDQRNADYNCPTEPMYNVLEGPTPGVRKEAESCGPISVNEPFYNTVEKPVSNEGLSRGNYDPVYNTLEHPLYLGFGGGGQNGPTGLQDPVYNVLEGPGADVVECKVSKDDTVAV